MSSIRGVSLPILCLIVIAAILSATIPGCGGSDTIWPDDARPKVVVSFAPIYCFAANVAGEDAVVRNMMTSTGPHNFNPTDVEARLLRRADLFFVNGLGLDENAADALKKGSGNRKLKVIELAERLPADALLAGQKHAGHDHGPHDPHIWLDPDLAIQMVGTIRDELQAADAAHAANYDQRAAQYTATLRKLKDDGRGMLKGKTDRKLVTFHESLSYFARAFDLTVEGVVQKKPGIEPDSDALQALVAMCQAKQVRLIAVEPQYGAAAAETILKELERAGIKDATLVVIDPLETCRPDELDANWYERKMRANLEALRDQMK